MPVICSVPTAGNRVALTFDDGRHIDHTRPILEALASHQARATFFIQGAALNRETVEIVSETFAAGHDVGNHTHCHTGFNDVGDATIAQQILLTHEQLEEITGQAPVLIRPPYGHALARVDAEVAPFPLARFFRRRLPRRCPPSIGVRTRRG